MNEHVWAELSHKRMQELRTEAAIERMARRTYHRRKMTDAVRRGYAHVWWAIRPRATATISGLFET